MNAKDKRAKMLNPCYNPDIASLGGGGSNDGEVFFGLEFKTPAAPLTGDEGFFFTLKEAPTPGERNCSDHFL